jgi:hypothetical protein
LSNRCWKMAWRSVIQLAAAGNREKGSGATPCVVSYRPAVRSVAPPASQPLECRQTPRDCNGWERGSDSTASRQNHQILPTSENRQAPAGTHSPCSGPVGATGAIADS